MSPTSPRSGRLEPVVVGRAVAGRHGDGPPEAGAVDEELVVFAEHVGVELIVWPRDDGARRSLARAGVPRLLLVTGDTGAPDGIGIDEDWVRLPADQRDVRARLERLARVVESLQHDHPVLDAAHIVHYGGTSVVLSTAQAALAELLLERPGRVVSRETLEAALWRDGAPGPKALDGVVFRLRRRLAGLGLVVRSAHARGFSIDPHDGPPAEVTDHAPADRAVPCERTRTRPG